MKTAQLRIFSGGKNHIPTLRELEEAHIRRVLAVEPNQAKAAELLGITTVTLWRKRKEMGLAIPLIG